MNKSTNKSTTPTVYIAYTEAHRCYGGVYYAGSTISDLLRTNEQGEILANHSRTIHPDFPMSTHCYFACYRKTENVKVEHQMLVNTIFRISEEFAQFGEHSPIRTINVHRKHYGESRVDVEAAQAILNFIIADITVGYEDMDNACPITERRMLRLAKKLLKKYS